MSATGFVEKTLHKSLKCYLQQGDFEVVLGVKDGYTFTVGTNWESPFGGDTAGEKVGRAAKLIQKQTGITSVTQLNSALTWTGNEPLRISFTGVLIANTKASIYKDVQQSFAAILAMASPNVHAFNPLAIGKRPGKARMMFLNNLFLPEVILNEVPIETGARTHHESGLPLSAEIQLEVSTETMLNFQDFANIFKR